MEISVLGPLRVPNGASLGPTQRRLLALLATRAGEVVPTERIAEELAVTTPSVRTAIARLRSVIGPGLRTEPPGYLLDADTLDATRFETLSAAARSAPVAETLQIADVALGLWRGSAFAEFDHEEWAIGRASGLNEQRWALTEDRVAALMRLGRSEEAGAAAEQLIGEQPFRERPRELLMTSLLEQGRRTEALRVFQVYRRLLAEEAGTEPSPSLVALDARIAAGVESTVRDAGERGGERSPAVGTAELVEPPAAGARAVVPRSLTSWIGPTDRLDRIGNVLVDGGLLTLTGPGGVGKTRTAIELAGRMAEHVPSGIRFVEFGALDADATIAATATALAVQPQPGMTMIESIVEWARGRRMLLILDNCEHVLGPMAELVSAMLDGAPTVTILATSREPLGLSGERIEPIEPMSPEIGIELFIARARATGALADLDEAQRSVIASLCEHLDGVPLAIELAAARARTLALPDLLARLDDRFHLLRSPPRDADQHHRTLRDVVEWSYRLLDPTEQRLLDCASVFSGGFEVDACRSVLDDRSIRSGDLIDALIGLVDKSMLVADRTGTGTRFRMFETVRLYARERLDERDEADRVRRCFVEHVVDQAEATALTWMSPRQIDADRTFDVEWGNLRSAFTHAVETGDLESARRVVVATNPTAFCRLRHEHAAWTHRVLELDPTDALVAGIATRWAWAQLDHQQLVEHARAGMAAAPPPDPRAATCRSFLAMLLLVSGRLDEAEPLFPLLRTDLATADDPYTRVLTLFPLALDATARNSATTASSEAPVEPEPSPFRLMADEATQVGAPSMLASAAFFNALGLLAEKPVDVDGVEICLRTATEHARRARDAVWEIQAMNVTAQAAVRFRSADAVRHCRAVLDRAYDTRFWVIVAQAAPVALAALEEAGRHEAASTIVGALERHFPVVNPIARDICGPSIDAARRRDGAAGLIARGAAMERDEMARFILDELAAAEAARPT